MRHDIYVDADSRRIVEVYEGDWRSETIIAVWRQTSHSTEFDPSFDRLVDLRRARIACSIEQIDELAAAYRKIYSNGGLTAVLTDDPRTTALVHVLAGKNKTWHLRPFSTPGAALRWFDAQAHDPGPD